MDIRYAHLQLQYETENGKLNNSDMISTSVFTKLLLRNKDLYFIDSD